MISPLMGDGISLPGHEDEVANRNDARTGIRVRGFRFDELGGRLPYALGVGANFELTPLKATVYS
tara:strand:+ start:300 stop:494 length:195 start_codon:yes stop_codon:yes gene_type:complete